MKRTIGINERMGRQRVELTWDEFNAMREAAGFRPAGRIEGDEKKSGLNHRLRLRIQELEASAKLSSTVLKDSKHPSTVCGDQKP